MATERKPRNGKLVLIPFELLPEITAILAQFRSDQMIMKANAAREAAERARPVVGREAA